MALMPVRARRYDGRSDAALCAIRAMPVYYVAAAGMPCRYADTLDVYAASHRAVTPDYADCSPHAADMMAIILRRHAFDDARRRRRR